MLPEGDGSMFCMLARVVDIQIAYSYSLYFSDQFSCIKFFDLSYGLKDIDFQSLNQFKSFSGIVLIFKSNITQNSDS